MRRVRMVRTDATGRVMSDAVEDDAALAGCARRASTLAELRAIVVELAERRR